MVYQDSLHQLGLINYLYQIRHLHTSPNITTEEQTGITRGTTSNTDQIFGCLSCTTNQRKIWLLSSSVQCVTLQRKKPKSISVFKLNIDSLHAIIPVNEKVTYSIPCYYATTPILQIVIISWMHFRDGSNFLALFWHITRQ